MDGKASEQQGRVLLDMARASIGKKLGIQCPAGECIEDNGFLDGRQGVFVTLHKRGRLRGCIGTIEPVKSLREGICENAVFAAFNDHRFPPLAEDEFHQVDIEISLLSVPERLEFDTPQDLVEKLVPHSHGVILEKNGARATFLPQVWEQLPDPREFLGHLCKKAGLPPDAWQKTGLTVYTYGVQSFSEKGSPGNPSSPGSSPGSGSSGSSGSVP